MEFTLPVFITFTVLTGKTKKTETTVKNVTLNDIYMSYDKHHRTFEYIYIYR